MRCAFLNACAFFLYVAFEWLQTHQVPGGPSCYRASGAEELLHFEAAKLNAWAGDAKADEEPIC